MTALLLVPWMLFPGAVCCPQQDKQQPEAKVKVTVVVILASERCPFIDPLLKNVANEIQNADPSLTGFRLISMTQRTLTVDKKSLFPCVEDCTVEVVIHQCPDKADKVCLAVTAPLQGEIVYRCVCGKFLPIITRYQTRERIPPAYMALAVAHLGGANAVQQMWALDTLHHGRCRDRLILAISVQPCSAK